MTKQPITVLQQYFKDKIKNIILSIKSSNLTLQ
jgi:hypothetical protein